MEGRLNLVTQVEPYIGKYYSQDYVRRQILRQTDEEILEQDYLIEKEIAEGVIPDPNAPAELPPEAPGQPGAVVVVFLMPWDLVEHLWNLKHQKHQKLPHPKIPLVVRSK